MKIAVLSSHTPSLRWFRMDMMLDFIARGHSVVAVGNEDEAAWRSVFEEYGIVYRKADIQRNGVNPLKDFKTLLSLKKIIEQEKPDKIFTYQAKTVVYGSIAANQLGITEVYPLIAGVGSVFLSETLKAKVIRSILKIEYRIAMKKCPKVFFQNQDDVELFVKHGIVDKNKIVMLNGSGVNTERFTPQAPLTNVAFLCIGRLIRDKGIYEYLEACKLLKEKYPCVKCMLVGPYDTNPSAMKEEELAPYIDNKIVEYYGEQKDVVPYLEQCSVFVLPSYREGTPKTVLEAMSCCKAIITTDAPGCRETVVDGENGFLVPVRDIHALAEKMTFFVNNPEVVERMGKAGRKMVELKFDVKLVNKTIEQTMKI